MNHGEEHEGWNSSDTLPKDGTRIRILWSNGKEDIGYFDRLNYGTPWVEQFTKTEHPDIYAEGGEWVTEFGEGDSAEFRPIGWLSITDITTFKTLKGSWVKVHPDGFMETLFQGIDEDYACFDCEVDLDATRASGFTLLTWRCLECGGGSAPLTRDTEDHP